MLTTCTSHAIDAALCDDDCGHATCSTQRGETSVPSVHTLCREADPDRKLGCLRQRFGRLWEVSLPTGDARPMDLVDWNLGELVVVVGSCPDRILRRTARQLNADQVDHYMLYLSLGEGSTTLRGNGDPVAVGTGEAGARRSS